MDRSCGNCAMSLDKTERLVMCKPDLLPAEWHQKTDVCDSCEYFRPIHQDVKLVMCELLAEYYQGENTTPIAVVVKCSDGRRFLDQAGRIYQVRCAKWVKADSFYSENGNRYRREVWRPGGSSAERAAGLPVVVSTKNEIGPRQG